MDLLSRRWANLKRLIGKFLNGLKTSPVFSFILINWHNYISRIGSFQSLLKTELNAGSLRLVGTVDADYLATRRAREPRITIFPSQ